MGWTYSDYTTQASERDQLTRLNLHIKEVSDKVSTPDTTSDGTSSSKATLQNYLNSLFAERARLQQLLGITASPNVGFGRFATP